MNLPPLGRLALIPLIGLLAQPRLRADAASATTDPANPDKEQAVELTKVVVTGSNIPTAANATASPVNIIGQQQMDQAGVNANMLELLRKQLPSITGRSNIGASNANNVNQPTLGGSQLALRNLDTLVLINGRRTVGLPGSSSTDLNNIASELVDHVEVVTGGASAVYGSEAISGVVNFVLKRNFEGLAIHG